MRRIAFKLFLALLAACGAGFAALGVRGRLLPAEVASPELQFEFLAAGSLLLLWGIMQLALDGREEKTLPPPPAPPAAASEDVAAAALLAARAARLNGRLNGRGTLGGDHAIAPPDSNWN